MMTSSVMVDRAKPAECAPSLVKSSKMSSYRDCVCLVLTLIEDFGKQLKVGDAALRIEVNMDALDLPSSADAAVSRCLQEHISKLQAVSENFNTLAAADSSSLRELRPPGSEAADSKALADDIMVQIRARKSEIERRISAFMERKQMEINENNVREFCNVIDCNQENSCARTDAVFTPYPGFKSHVKVSRVVNTYGPQTRGGQGAAGEQQRGPVTRDCGNAAIEERLHNIETHLKLPAVGPVPLSVYHRLKKLEDRILELEGLSPEYFQSSSLLHKRPKTSAAQACSLTELDQKISAVKAALMKRMNDFSPGYGTESPL